MQLGKAYEVESHVLGPKETLDLYPLMNVSDVYGTLYVPSDGSVDPAGYCTALTRAAQSKGAKVSSQRLQITTTKKKRCQMPWMLNIDEYSRVYLYNRQPGKIHAGTKNRWIPLILPSCMEPGLKRLLYLRT